MAPTEVIFLRYGLPVYEEDLAVVAPLDKLLEEVNVLEAQFVHLAAHISGPTYRWEANRLFQFSGFVDVLEGRGP